MEVKNSYRSIFNVQSLPIKPFIKIGSPFYSFFILLLLGCAITSLNSCKVDTPIVEESTGFPQEVGTIILTKCAVSGCHNEKSKKAAAGLSFESWDSMFEGSNNGSIAIPFNHAQSPLFLFTNIYSELGVSVTPTMPVGSSPLSKEEVIILRDWIDAGAPNRNGIVKFSDDRNRKKIYVANQGCDLVNVIDEETNLIMRAIKVGSSENIESPHMIRVSPDGNYWYVVFYAGSVIQKYNAIDDSFVAEAEVGYGSWNTLAISDDSKTAFAVDWSANGRVACIDLETMTLKKMFAGNGLFIYPHGVTINENFVYVTAQTGNFIYKIEVSDINFPEFEEISLAKGEAPSTISSLDPHEIIFSPDQTKYFVSCQKSNEVRVMDTVEDTLIQILETGQYPSELTLSLSSPYLFVSCPEDTLNFPSKGHGCITVVNYIDNSVVTNVYAGYQSHGIAVDDSKQVLYVANRNVYSSGPSPHHTTECEGRNGYMTILDINTLELIDVNFELSVDPYSVAFRKD